MFTLEKSCLFFFFFFFLLLLFKDSVAIVVHATPNDDTSACTTDSALLLSNEKLLQAQLAVIEHVNVTCTSKSVGKVRCVQDYSAVQDSYQNACDQAAGGVFQTASLERICTKPLELQVIDQTETANLLYESTHVIWKYPGCMAPNCPEDEHARTFLASFAPLDELQSAENFTCTSFILPNNDFTVTTTTTPSGYPQNEPVTSNLASTTSPSPSKLLNNSMTDVTTAPSESPLVKDETDAIITSPSDESTDDHMSALFRRSGFLSWPSFVTVLLLVALGK